MKLLRKRNPGRTSLVSLCHCRETVALMLYALDLSLYYLVITRINIVK